MKTLRKLPLCTLAIAIAIALASLPTQAEVYKWTDKDGKVQYSDKPPPDDAAKAKAKVVDTKPAINPGAKAQSADKETFQDQEIEFKKRRVAAEKAQDKEDEAAREAAKVEDKRKARCTDMRLYVKDLQEPVPVYIRDDKGEKKYLSDKEREAEMARTREGIAKYCE